MIPARAAETSPVQLAFERLRRAQRATPYPSVEERRDRLARLERLLVRNRERLAEVIDTDFGGRSRNESMIADVLATVESVRYARSHVASWMKPRRVSPSPYFLPARTWVESLPLGVVGIVSPWNYPVNLALAPLAFALAAGNRALIKPSELTPKTSAALAELVAEHFTAEEVVVLEGGVEVAREVTALPLDHLLFTGSTVVGRQVAVSAAANLTPVTLELGGKSPCLIHPDYPVARAADRIAAGKLFNAGQTCVAPDYVLLAEGQEDAFVSAFRTRVEKAYPGLPDNPRYTAVLTPKHFERLQRLLEEAERKGARLVHTGGAPDAGTRRMAPVLVLGATDEMGVMREEIFGPILPVRTFTSLDAALEAIADRPHPLAFYYFDAELGRAREILRRTTSGGACLNDTLAHFAQEELPFGGVGHSGMGAYHGRSGFDAFSHRRGVLQASRYSAAHKLQVPPYGKFLERFVDTVLDRGVPLPRVVRGLLGR